MADELCVIRTLHTDIVEHFQAVLAMHTGSATVPLPSLGAWLSYGLGTFNPNLPSYVVLCEHLPYAGIAGLGQQLPAADPSGRADRARARADSRPAPARRVRRLRRAGTDDAAATSTSRHAAARPDDADLRARIATFDIGPGDDARGPRGRSMSRAKPRPRCASYGDHGRRQEIVWLSVPDRPPADRARACAWSS